MWAGAKPLFDHVLVEEFRDCVGLAHRQQHGLPSAERTIPDLLIYLDTQPPLCAVTVADTLASSKLATASRGAGLLPKEAAQRKVAKYALTASAMGAVHLPFTMELNSSTNGDAGRAERDSAAAHPSRAPFSTAAPHMARRGRDRRSLARRDRYRRTALHRDVNV